jgi:hypothetical protein
MNTTEHQLQQRHDTTSVGGGEPSRVWGLTASDLHDAYWGGLGVQCVRRGRSEPFQPGADLFLLVEPDQHVLFDLIGLMEHLAWRGATVTRVRVTEGQGTPYREQVDMDARGVVRSVTRHYHARGRGTYRVMLTSRRRIVQIWMRAGMRREAWKKIRSVAGRQNIDNVRCEGACFAADQHGQDARFIDHLVRTWRHPGNAIAGIEEIKEGVWGPAGGMPLTPAACVGPTWLGSGALDGPMLRTVGIPASRRFAFATSARLNRIRS